MTPDEINKLAMNGKFEKVPLEYITRDTLLTKSNDKKSTPTICWVIANKQLHLVPKPLLTHEVLNQTDKYKTSGYSLAARLNQFDIIPDGLITLKILEESSFDDEEECNKIWEILLFTDQTTKLIPFINQLINKKTTIGCPFLHACAQASQIGIIPKKYLTKERIVDRLKPELTNVIDYAAEQGCLNQIPKEFINMESMSQKDCFNKNPLHRAARGGNLHLVPKEFLTRELLEQEGKDGSVFHEAAIYLTFNTFPTELITEKDLIKKDKINNLSPILILAEAMSSKDNSEDIKESAKDQLSKLIKLLPYKNLSNFKNELVKNFYTNPLKLIGVEMCKRKLSQKIHKSNILEI
jgi:hypothetical protein